MLASFYHFVDIEYFSIRKIGLIDISNVDIVVKLREKDVIIMTLLYIVYRYSNRYAYFFFLNRS